MQIIPHSQTFGMIEITDPDTPKSTAEKIYRQIIKDTTRQAGVVERGFRKKTYQVYASPAKDLIPTSGGGSNTEYKQKLKSLQKVRN